MKTLCSRIFFGTGNRLNGVAALSILILIALGCTCGQEFDLSNVAGNGNSAEAAANTGEATAPATTREQDVMPDPQLLNALVKSTTATFAQAVSSNDFSKLYNEASPDFQKTYTLAQVAEIFKPFVDDKSRYLPSLAKISGVQAEYSPEPYVKNEQGLDILVTSGTFNTPPNPINFEYEYVKRGGKWKIVKLIIKM